MVSKNERKPRFEIYRDKGKNKEFRWRLKSENREIISSGEGYTTKQECKEGIQAVREDAQIAEIVDLVTESD